MRLFRNKEQEKNEALDDLLERGIEKLIAPSGWKRLQLRLTSREIEVCDLIRVGIASKDIARTHSISLKTVEKHRDNIRKKLGIANRINWGQVPWYTRCRGSR
ncbi:MAG: helix-turn-helix transcriptional regulator [Candidatus Auribacterota bacterium]|nr:helix-turn-helix transcriptional regulator [Candidatus Auribacterota bacterium]